MTSHPFAWQRYASLLTSLNLSLALPFITPLPPCCLISRAGDGGRRERWRGSKMRKRRKAQEQWQKKEKVMQRQREAERQRGRDRDAKWEQEIEPSYDRLAASAGLTEMSPLNGFPVLDAGPPYLISILLGSCSSDDLYRTQNRSLTKCNPCSR